MAQFNEETLKKQIKNGATITDIKMPKSNQNSSILPAYIIIGSYTKKVKATMTEKQIAANKHNLLVFLDILSILQCVINHFCSLLPSILLSLIQ